jgi:glycosyltransferase involved in cell wall biosynthesis
MRDAETRRAREAAARRLVVERYDWSAVALDFENALLRVADTQAVAERAIA